jgi:hypothetical protein
MDVLVVEHPAAPFDECYCMLAGTEKGQRACAVVMGERVRVGVRELLRLQARAALDGLEIAQVKAH